MYSAKNLDFHQYCGDLSESIDYLESQIGNESPIEKNNILSFRSFPKNMPAYSSEKDLLQAFSMEEQIMNNPISNSQKYKCFRCYDQVKSTSRYTPMANQLETACQECEGTSFISDSHALASILQKVLMLKFPSLAVRGGQLKKEDARKTKQFNSLFGSQNSIQQQYYPDQSCRQCSGCYQEFESYKLFGCKQCKDFAVCFTCYERKRFHHPLDHSLFSREQFKLSLRICPTTMKKISQEGELQDNSNYLDSSQSLEIKCASCSGFIQQCYEVCLTCENDGYQYIICAECSRQNNYLHQPSHQLAMKTYKQASKLLRLSSKPSASESEVTLPTPSKSKLASKGSIIKIDNFDNEEIEEHHQNQNLEKEIDFTHLLVKKKGKKMQKMEQSVVSIDMECSLEAPSAESDFTRTFTPYAFSNTTNQKIQEKPFNPEEYLFNDYRCDICEVTPIKNKRYHCKVCQNYDLCELCYETRSKRHQHKDYQLIDGLQIVRKNRQSLMTKIGSQKSRLSMSRVSITQTRWSEFSSFK